MIDVDVLIYYPLHVLVSKWPSSEGSVCQYVDKPEQLDRDTKRKIKNNIDLTKFKTMETIYNTHNINADLWLSNKEHHTEP
jgi:hypothetical protein